MQVKIEKLIYGGEGLAHHDGATVFVPFVLPDEEVAIQPVERKKKFVRGRVERILTASPERSAAPCPHFGVCGGCHYQHIPYEAQLRYKGEILRETLRRLGRIEWGGPITTHASPPWQYRNRAQWKVRPLAGSDRSKRLAIGYFHGGSTALCAVEECPILSPSLFETFTTLRAALASGTLPPALREVDVFADAQDNRLLMNASFGGFPASVAALAEKLRGSVAGLESLLIQDTSGERMELFGPGYLSYEVAGHPYRVGHLSFFQVNRFLVEEMAQAVCAAAGEGELALDLFAGVGLFTVPLAQRFARIVAVEANPASARDLETNLAGTRGRAEGRNEEVESFLAKCTEVPDVVILDPPRAGVSPTALARLATLGPARIVYVSCDPATLARDLAQLTATGYMLTEVHLFDLFPQSFHLESLVQLTRSK
jgi:23S rRNA (uracil1939-C5)-methyltransferase